MNTNKGKNHLANSLELNDTVWDHIVLEALEIGMTSEEYIKFIKFINELYLDKKTLEKPAAYYFQIYQSNLNHQPNNPSSVA